MFNSIILIVIMFYFSLFSLKSVISSWVLMAFGVLKIGQYVKLRMLYCSFHIVDIGAIHCVISEMIDVSLAILVRFDTV